MIEETLSATKLIISFANEDKECEKFNKLATEVKETAYKSEKLTALFVASVRFFIFGFYVYSFWIAT